MIKRTLVLDDILDQAKGWPFSQTQVPIERFLSDDGNPMYSLTVDGVVVNAFEITRWADGSNSNIDPTSIAILTVVDGLFIDNMEDPSGVFHSLLLDGFATRGDVCPGFDADGQGYFQASLPFAEGFPIKWLRKQFMVKVGLVANQTGELERALAGDSTEDDEDDHSDDGFTSKAVNLAGSFAGQMLRSFVLGT